MNTPAHAVLGLALLDRASEPIASPRTGAILAGAILPDLPIFLFYGWQRLALGTPDALIWTEVYFRPSWQAFFDAFNSLPLAAAGWALAHAAGLGRAAAFFAAMALHAVTDLPVHHDDAHRHFLPFSDWRWASPVSYWDPQHFGTLAAAGEATLVAVASVLLWRRYRRPPARAGLLALNLLYLAAYAAFYLAR